jgi:hypothetical protein
LNLEQYEQRLRQLPCVVCFYKGMVDPADPKKCEALHHAGHDTDRSDWNQVPICHYHHQGSGGIHTLHRRGFEAQNKMTEMDMLAITRKLYAKEFE